MEFWGSEIKPGSPIKVEPEHGYIIHVTQVTLGESKKVKDEAVHFYVKVGDGNQKLLIGNLSQKIPQLSMDLIFEQGFELSHECQNSSVFVLGYQRLSYDEQDDEEFDSDDEEIPMELAKSNANGLNDEKAKVEAGESDSDEEDESDSDEMGSDEDEDDSDEEEEEEEEAPVEAPSKKRPNGGAVNNTNASKKAKVACQQKPSGAGGRKKCC